MAAMEKEVNVPQERHTYHVPRDEEAGCLRKATTESSLLSQQTVPRSKNSTRSKGLERTSIVQLALALPVRYWTLYV